MFFAYKVSCGIILYNNTSLIDGAAFPIVNFYTPTDFVQAPYKELQCVYLSRYNTDLYFFVVVAGFKRFCRVGLGVKEYHIHLFITFFEIGHRV